MMQKPSAFSSSPDENLGAPQAPRRPGVNSSMLSCHGKPLSLALVLPVASGRCAALGSGLHRARLGKPEATEGFKALVVTRWGLISPIFNTSPPAPQLIFPALIKDQSFVPKTDQAEHIPSRGSWGAHGGGAGIKPEVCAWSYNSCTGEKRHAVKAEV